MKYPIKRSEFLERYEFLMTMQEQDEIIQDEVEDPFVYFAGDILARKSEEEVQDADMRDIDDDDGYYMVAKGE